MQIMIYRLKRAEWKLQMEWNVTFSIGGKEKLFMFTPALKSILQKVVIETYLLIRMC